MWLPGLLLAALTVPLPTPQQQSDTALAARLERAERQIELLRQQVTTLTTSRVEPRARHRVELSGLVLANAFYNNVKTNNSDVPAFVPPPDAPGLPASGLGATVRQSQVALTAVVPSLAGGSFTGELDVDFFGGQQPSGGGRTFPLIRIRRVRAELTWDNAWLVFGQDGPPIAELNPSSLSQLGLPSFANAGNLWLWIPQARIGAEAGGTVRVGLEASALAPTAGEPQAAFLTQPDRAERSGRPAAEGRVRVRWDAPKTGGELSLGGHVGWLATTGDSLLRSRAAAASIQLRASSYVELRAEVFTAEAVAGLGGGAIGQNLGPGDVPVRTKGGWVQLNLTPTPNVELGAGYGLDDPRDGDLDQRTARLKNTSWETHVHWRPHPLVIGAEFRRIATTYAAPLGILQLSHVNLAAGFEF